MGREARESAAELRGVAPLVVLGGARPELVGPCLLVTNGAKTIAIASAELLRQAGEPLGILTKLDGSRSIPVTAWLMAQQLAIGIIELGASATFTPEVQPVQLGSVSATLDTRGAPSALVVIRADDHAFVRRVIPVHVDAIDRGASDDVITWLVSPDEPRDLDAEVEGAPLFAWMPPDPVLGRTSEVVAVALGVSYHARTFKPRELPAIAELVGLEDVGRALPWTEDTPEPCNDLGQIAGEIRDDATGPLAGLDLDPEE